MNLPKVYRAAGQGTSVTLLAAGTLGIGTFFRRQRGGPERTLVNWFLENIPVQIPSGCRMTVFQEPRLESGFPDLSDKADRAEPST